jgi:ATP-dependent DNA ligase
MIKPMLVSELKSFDGLEYPLYAQPKYDGHRCLAVVEGRTVTLYSKNGNIITSVPHINDQLSEILPNTTVILDGELYSESLDFEDLSSVVRTQTPSADSDKVIFVVFDIVERTPFQSRKYLYEYLLRDISLTHILPVDTYVVEDEEDLVNYYKSSIILYEGIILRPFNSLYEDGKRSKSVLKLKPSYDSEFQVLSISRGSGKASDCSVLTLSSHNGVEFKVLAHIPPSEDYLSKMATVKYAKISKYGVPIHPVFLRFREDV